MKFTEEERKFMVKILEESKVDTEDSKFLIYIDENLKKLKYNIIDKDVLDWFDGFFSGLDPPKGSFDDENNIRIAKSIEEKIKNE